MHGAKAKRHAWLCPEKSLSLKLEVGRGTFLSEDVCTGFEQGHGG
jgi:hypothetical protein